MPRGTPQSSMLALPQGHTSAGCVSYSRTCRVCVDPAPFTLSSSDRVEIRQELFDAKIAKEFSDRDTYEHVLFISDIRTADPDLMDEQEIDGKIRDDMQMQQEWHLLMRPARSMLKFRLSWEKGITNYLDGDVHLPIWGPTATTESRLITHAQHGEMRK